MRSACYASLFSALKEREEGGKEGEQVREKYQSCKSGSGQALSTGGPQVKDKHNTTSTGSSHFGACKR